MASGRRAIVRNAAATGDEVGDQGTFVWADSTDSDFQSTGANQFLIRAGGGVGIGTNAPTDPLTVNGLIRSLSGGFKFPDGTVQATAGDGHSLNAADGTPVDALFVDNDGDVGVGTTSPVNKLDVEGAMAIGATYSGAGMAPANGLIVQGNIGVGTPTPINKLDVEGSAAIGMGYSGTNTAPANGLIVEGGLGLGTTAPVNKLDVEGSVVIGAAYSGTNAAPTNGLLVEGKVGIGTIAPGMSLEVSTPTYYGKPTMGVADVGSGYAYLLADSLGDNSLIWDNGRAMRFGTETARATGYFERMRIQPNGNVGIGTNTPTSKLEIAAQDGLAITGFQPFFTLRDSNASNARTQIANAGGSLNFFPESFIGMNPPLMIETGSGRVGIGDTTPDVALDVIGDIHYTGVITDVSDERLKENIHPIQSALDKVARLHGVSFSMKGTPDAREVGLIAQDVQKVLPEAVRVVDPENGYLGVSYPSVIALLVEAIKDVKSEISDDRGNVPTIAAVEELHRIVKKNEWLLQERDCQIQEAQSEISNLKSQISEMRQMVMELTEKSAGGGQ